MRKSCLAMALPGLMLLAPAAGAHSVGAEGAAFAAGVAHPLLGFDHLLALLGAGLWAGWLGGRARHLLPGGFLAGLLGGALLAWGGVGLPWVEPMIMLSVLLFGLLAAAAARPSTAVGGAVLFVLALFHGHAHGMELPRAAEPALYLLGFLAASALVQLAAMHIAVRLCSGRLAGMLRVAGGAVAALGGAWLIGA